LPPLVIAVAEAVFWAALAGVVYSYVVYPVLLRLLAGSKPLNDKQFSPDTSPDEWPAISVVMSAYNEATGIENKVRNLFQTRYPAHKIEFLVGSDASSDGTDDILRRLAADEPRLRVFSYSDRSGKPEVVNRLVQQARYPLLVLTDAKALFDPDTLPNLVRHFANPRVGLVSARIENRNYLADGISYQEKTYFSLEAQIKVWESQAFGAMIGAFGACYALYKTDYCPTPAGFVADDFYISMQVLLRNKLALLDPQSVCYQNTSNRIQQEFRRKTRIGVGNFQNLFRLRGLLSFRWPGLTFCYFSHKVLRWLTPFFIILCLITNILLYNQGPLYQFLLLGQLSLLLLAVGDLALKAADVHLRLLRFIRHFYVMNAALMFGFWKYLRGTPSNIWEPTQRK